MPAPSKIELLPERLRAELDRRLVGSAFAGYDALADWLSAQGVDVGRSTVHRYGQRLERRLAAIKASTEAARQIAEAAPDDADERSNAIISLVQTEIFEAILALQEADESDPGKRVEMLGKAAKNIATLTRASVARNRWAQELRDKIKATAERVGERLRGAGVDEEEVKRTVRDIYGLGNGQDE